MANRMNNRKNVGVQRRYFDRGGSNGPRFNPWQGGVVPNSNGNSNGGGNVGNVGPDPTFALASNLLNMLQTRPNPMPSLLDLNVRRDFGDNYGNNYGNNRFQPKMYGRNMPMGGQMNRRIMSGRNDRPINKIRRPMRPNIVNKAKSVPKVNQEKKDPPESKPATVTESVPVKKENEEIKQEPAVIEQSNDNVDEEKADEKDDGKKTDGVKTEFDDIAANFLECHICEKRMWDGRSFDNHIKGRVHNIMMDKTKQSYHMTADAMRQELKIYEMKRSRRGVPGAKKVFCPMCDLYVFYAAAHRRSPGHQKLKKYLHPSCNTCRKEFPTRIELDEHRLTAPHLRLLQTKSKDVQTRAKPEVVMITTLQEEMAQVRPMHEIKKKRDNEETTVEIKTEDIKVEDGAKNDAMENEEPQEEKVLLLDYKEGDDLTDMTRENLPRYQTDRPVGSSYISVFTCHHCSLCKKYFDTEETAEVHLRTWKHFQAFIRLIHSKGNFKVNQDKQETSTDELTDNIDSKRRKLDDIKDEIVANDDDAVKVENTNGTCEENATSEINNSDSQEAIDISVDSSIKESDVTDTSTQPVIETKTQQRPKGNRGRGRGRGRGNWSRRGYNRV